MSNQLDIDFSIHENSLTVYAKNVLPELSERQRKVLEALERLGSATCAEIAEHLNTFPHCVSGRITEMKKTNRIISIGKRYINGRPNEVWKTNEQLNIAA